MKKSSLMLLCGLGLLPAAASATSVGYWPWYAQVQGTVSHQGRAVDLRDELGYRNSASHGWLVDDGWLRVSYMPLNYRGHGTLAGEATFGNATFTDSTEVRSSADVVDLAARVQWHFLKDDRLGLGFTVKVLDGEFEVREDAEDGASDRKTFSQVLPLASFSYRQPIFDLFFLELETDYIGFENDWVLDVTAAVRVRLDPVSLRMGWHQKEIDISDGDSALDATAKGAFAQLRFDLGS